MTTQKLKLEFPLAKLSVPVFSKLASDFDVQPNVLAADINPSKGGWLLLGISGDETTLAKATAWIAEQGITITPSD